MNSDIAIIGIALRLPEADDVEQFYRNLAGRRDSVRELSVTRRASTGLPLEEDYQISGFIEDIVSFDYAFFGMSRGEAQNMAPEHRLLLQLAYQAVENAGYDPADLRGKAASVYVGDTKLEYASLARVVVPTMVMGTHVAATAGRISRFLGLRGAAAMVDSSCSSGLLAVHHAVNDLVLGDAELALVCAVNLNLFGEPKGGHELDLGIRSVDGKTRCFSADADGTGSGEAAACVLLKPLAAALRDDDPIQAVIKGIAANNVAGRSSTLTAPDSAAQAEVLTRAWAKAGINPETVTYIEAHGTATRLGDPIEVEAIDLAFRQITDRRGFCALSSVKSNIGHTWSASGMVGLIKAVLALRHQVLFPNVHTETLSPLINFAESAVNVTRELTPWQPEAGVRRAGVSAFGVMGTNVHAVLEEAPTLSETPEFAELRWFPISAKTLTALEANLLALRRTLDERADLRVSDIQRTLVAGRGHFQHRYCVVARDRAELVRALATPGPTGQRENVATVLLLSGHCPASPELTTAMRTNTQFDQLYAQCLRAAETSGVAGEALIGEFAFQYAMHGLLCSIGLQFKHVVSAGAGKHVLDTATGRVELGKALRRALDEPEPTDLDARVDRMLDNLVGDGQVLFVECGPLATVSRALADRDGNGYDVVAVPADAGGVSVVLRELYLAGAKWQWVSTAGEGRRIGLPSYQFDKVRCWLDEENLIELPPADDTDKAPVRRTSGVDYMDAVIHAWRDALKLDEVDPETSFYELGGDSISSIHVLDRLRAAFGVDLDPWTMLDYDTPLALAQHVEQLVASSRSVDGTAESLSVITESFPASAAQLNIWLASQFEGGSIAFNLTRCLELSGPIDRDALHRALDALLERHDGLRASFAFTDGELSQRVNAPTTAHLELRSHDVGEVDYHLVREFAGRPFDLEHGPLLRAQLLSFGEERHVLTLSTHHIVVDGWSLELLVRDLGTFYSAFARDMAPKLPPVGADYRKHHVRHAQRASETREKSAAYWLDLFDPVPAALDMPLSRTVSGRSFEGAYRNYALSRQLHQRLTEFTRARSTTLFITVLSAFAALLARHSEHGDLVLGTSIAGRDGEAVEQLVAMLVRTLPLRVGVDPEKGFCDLCGQVRTVFGDALRHLDFPYEDLVAELRRRGANHSANLFDVLIEYERFGVSGESGAGGDIGFGSSARQLDVSLPTSVHPLNIMLCDKDGTLAAAIRFDTARFNEQWVDRLWEDFQAMLAAMLDLLDCPLRELPLLSEREQLRVSTLGYRELRFDQTVLIHHAVERHAVEHPDQLCLSHGADQRTYGQLSARANQFARYFSSTLGVRPGDVVALVMNRSILMVESILALWKCGAAYLPIDPYYPAAFARQMLESSSVRLVVLDPARQVTELRSLVPDGCRLIELTDAATVGQSTADLALTVSASALSYVIYTSGSTGVPKGAMVEHIGMLNHLHAKIVDLELTERSVVVQNASNSFDISVWQMFAALFVGGRTVIVDQTMQLDPLVFAKHLKAERVTVLELVPSYLDAMLDSWELSDRKVDLVDLRHLLVTGEACLPRQVNRWLSTYPDVPMVNAYGPTEASDDVTHHVMTEPVDTDSVPIGRPIPNTMIYVLDEYLRVCPQGARGEIYVSGICVGRGYLNAPDQTARSFLRDPFQPERRMYRTGDVGRWTDAGKLEYLGRADSQVKVRGFRVDLSEIERRVDGSPGVKAAAVVSRTVGRDRQLCAYVVLKPGGSLERCRAHLARTLPQHMVPTDFVAVERLPLNSNGKVDRKALAVVQPVRTDAAHRAGPSSETERLLVEIWRDVLGRPDLGVSDRFFDVGGDSLRAIQILTRIRAELNITLTLETLFARPTVAELALVLANSQAGASSPITSLGGPGRYAVAPSQQLLLEIERSSKQRAACNRNDLFELVGDIDPDRLRRAFTLVIERHESLRTTYEEDVQVVHPVGELEVPFHVHDLRGQSDAAVREFVASRIRVAFDIMREPLIRADLLRTGQDRWQLLTSMHQLVSDGVSAGVMLHDLEALYDGRQLPVLSVQYKDVAAWLAERLTPQRQAEHREFWCRELAGATSQVLMPTDYPRPPVSALSGTRLRLPVPNSLTDRMAEVAAAHAVTEFVVARCAVGLLLLAETGETEVTMGTYTQGRGVPGLNDQIGFHINTVPLRFRLAAGEDVSTLLTRGQQDVLRAFQHEEYPYGWTMCDLGWQRGTDRAPVFDVMIAFDRQTQPAPERTLFQPRELPRRSKEADLQFIFTRFADGMELALTYNDEIFTADRMNRLLVRLRTILDGLTSYRDIDDILKMEEPEI